MTPPDMEDMAAAAVAVMLLSGWAIATATLVVGAMALVLRAVGVL